MNRIVQPNLVSVIIPTYNRSRFLVEAVESVRAQSHRPLEVIIIDDGSEPCELTSVKEYIRHINCEPEFCVNLIEQQHLGQRIARNRGLFQSSGAFIQFLDDDDTLHPDKLAIQLESFSKDPALDVVVSQVAFCDSEMHPTSISNISERGWKGDMVDFFLDLKHDVATHAPLHRRKALEKISGWDERGKIGDEVSLHLRLAISGAKFAFFPNVHGYVRCHNNPGRVTTLEQKASAVAEKEFYQRIIEFSEIRIGCRDEHLRCGVAKRLFLIARRHYSTLNPTTANGCICAAATIFPEFTPIALRLYPLLGGLLGCLIECPYYYVKRVVKRVSRLIRFNSLI